MNDSYVMQREFSRSQGQVDRFGFIYLDCNFLTSRQHVVRPVGFALWQMRSLVSARNNSHATVFTRARRERYPSGGNVWRRQSPVGCVLVPRDKRLILWKFGEPLAAPNHNVRSEHTLDCVENTRMRSDLVDPTQKRSEE